MAKKTQNLELLGKLYKDYGLTESDIFKSKNQGYTIIKREGIEKIQLKEKIEVSFVAIASQKDFASVQAFGRIYREEEDTVEVQTFGSACKGEVKLREKKGKNKEIYEVFELVGGNTHSWYVLEIAEKRALARVVLKMTGLYKYGNVYSEDENPEEFRSEAEESKEKANNTVKDILKEK